MTHPVISDLGSLSLTMQAAAWQSALALQDIVKYPVQITFCGMELINEQTDINLSLPYIHLPGSVVKIKFEGGLVGAGFLILSQGQDVRLAQALFLQDACLQESENAVEMILSEIGNVLLNVYIGNLSNKGDLHIKYSVPQVYVRQNNTEWADELINGHIPPEQVLVLNNSLSIGEIQINLHIAIIINYA
ncbi:MAG: hypothetical protein LWX83_16720 [Anaerolineae bacterium]|nr:hypothetical protein [Anaerolineae bacterium]